MEKIITATVDCSMCVELKIAPCRKKFTEKEQDEDTKCSLCEHAAGFHGSKESHIAGFFISLDFFLLNVGFEMFLRVWLIHF